jgi:hypothetical protein
MANFKKYNTKEKLVQDAGAYGACILGAYDVDNGKAINFKLKLDNEYIGYLKLFLTKKDGTDNEFVFHKMRDLLDLLDREDLELVDNRYPQLDNAEVGVLLDISDDSYKNLQHLCWYNLETLQTAYEYLNELEPTRLEKMYAKLEKKYEQEKNA